MTGEILDTFREGTANCYLTRITLANYLASTPNDYQDYEVQREIVSNVYLDNLIQTILDKAHIPPLVLVVDENNFQIENNKIDIKYFKILDGLQRTYRLKAIHETIQLFLNELKKKPEILTLTKLQVSRTYKDELQNLGGSTIFIKVSNAIRDKKLNVKDLEKIFDRFQWFEIWSGLDGKKEVSKMLVLNAGHKPVKTKHQLELLFSNIIPILLRGKTDEFKIVKEKETSSIIFSKSRKVGEFHFSTLITSLLSFGEGMPLTTNIDLVQKKQNDDFDDSMFDELLTYDFVDAFIKTLITLDHSIAGQFGNEGVKWLGRETTLVGLFAAAGKMQKENMSIARVDALKMLIDKISSNPEILQLDDFERVRNSQDLGKINIGSVNKKAVFNAIYDILTKKSISIDWPKYFKNE